MLRLTLLAFLVGCSSKIMGTMPADTGIDPEVEGEDTEEDEDDGGSTGGSSGGSTGPSTTGGSSTGSSSAGGSSTGGSTTGGSGTGGSGGTGDADGSGSGSFELGPPPGEGGIPEPGLVCRDGSFFDCNLECLPIDPFFFWLGDAYCDEMAGANLNCEEFEYDLGDCVDPTVPEDEGDGTGGETGDGETTDGETTGGETADADTTGGETTDGETEGDETAGDDTSDDGATDDTGEPEPEPAIGEECGTTGDRVYDCSLACVDQDLALSWIGDDFCEDGTAYDGSYDLYCEEFDFDDGDCDDDGDTTGGEDTPEGTDPGAPCGAGRIYDCAETCGTGTLLWDFSEDEFCDDGTTWTFDLTCEYFNFDSGLCDSE